MVAMREDVANCALGAIWEDSGRHMKIMGAMVNTHG